MTSTRRPIIAANWRLQKTIAEAIDFVTRLKRETDDLQDLDIVVCPSFTALASVSEVLEGSDIGLGAQDLYWEPKGAFTGEVSAEQIKDAGCRYVIIGHSERRQFFGETDETVNRKLKAALAGGLLPIVCVGETLAQREAGITAEVVTKQFVEGFAGIPKGDFARIVVAYEPVWAIGTGKTATTAQAQEVHRLIRGLLRDKVSKEVAAALRIQYGGSVKPGNIADLMAQEDVDGALVGGASLDVESFSQILKYERKAKV